VFEGMSCTDDFAYILIVESDKDLRQSALHRVAMMNCAVYVVRNVDEAVHTASSPVNHCQCLCVYNVYAFINSRTRVR